ncbi:MAG: Uma2 family endonuclease [Acidobacteria bacterium]|nr:Uma2 family endonuclease [Acidobacteriota bacterium]
MTAAQFDALPVADGRRTELIDGVIVEVSSATALHNKIQVALIYLLMRYMQTRNIGKVLNNTESHRRIHPAPGAERHAHHATIARLVACSWRRFFALNSTGFVRSTFIPSSSTPSTAIR